MPLKKGYSKKVISQNVAKEKRSGKKTEQAVAIALNSARESAKKAGKPSKAPKRKSK